ncbi:hypothetical protein [Neisseria montereyensis]|uniref:Lipoprotein n=1 Tax=Neisseria montereyensis TaxID=2973938 RepID=A0ABT2FF15_9NEIS|nr:hypothetical protein [Neisseria montereyensis]MCS4534105.1 hypothetical protein [Neisseria montereyensis]
MLNACSPSESQALAATPSVPAVQPASVAKPVPVYRGNFLKDAAALAKAEDDLKSLPRFHGKDLKFFDNIVFFSGPRPRIELDIQNTENPERIDHYVYWQGTWRRNDILRKPPPPEKLNIAEHLTPLSQVRFADVADVAKVWEQKARSVNAVVDDAYYVSFVYLRSQNKRFWHTATIEAVGTQYYLSLNADKTVWEFKKL